VIFVERDREPPAALRSNEAKAARSRATRFFKRPYEERMQELHAFERDVYAAPSVEERLHDVFHGKCAFCESPRGQSQAPRVAHFRPAAGALDLDGGFHPDHYWWLAYEWRNLLPVCPDCARMKGTRFPVKRSRAKARANGRTLLVEGAEIIDPCSEDPEPHLVYDNDGFVSSGTRQGKTTIEILALNRWWLTIARAEALAAARDEWQEAETAIRTGGTAAEGALAALLSPEKPYAGIRRQFVFQWLDATTGIGSVSTELDAAHTAQLGSVVVREQQQLTREVFEQFEHSVRGYSLEGERGEGNDAYYMTARMIRRVEIRNFRIIRELDLDFPIADEANMPWLMLLGENGLGKSSILQAVTLALMGDEYRASLGLDARRLVSWGEKQGSVTVRLTGASQPIELSFSRKAKKFKCQPPEPKVLLMAYGATRLLPRARPRSGARASRDTTRFANVDNLFDPFVALNEPVRWLRELDDEPFAAVARALKRLLPLGSGDRLIRDATGVRIKAFGTTLTFDQLSDGYQSVLALATDMMQVLIHRWPAFEIAEGIVVIDELEAHLHPSWRMRIVESLRSVFPRLQFLATTHDPLCLRGLNDGEVMVLRRDANNHVFAIDDLPSLKGLRVDQLLTSEIFGLDSTTDPEIDELLSEYRALRVRTHDSARVKAREAEVRERLDQLQVLGRDARERLVLEAADQYLAEEPVIAEPTQRKALRAATKRRIASILAEGRGGQRTRRA
jgi:uncharacterized protein (TIGR02646 family)